MSTYRPLAPPLLDTAPHPDCRATVILPACNEESILPRTLNALLNQRDLHGDPLHPNSYELLLLANNCTDRTAAVAADFRTRHPGLHLHTIVRTLPPPDDHVGHARRLLMDTAHARLQHTPNAAILSTDADTEVAPDWIAQNRAALAAGADAVGGVIHLFPADLNALARQHPAVHLAYIRDREYQRLAARLESLLDPDPADPWPRHLHHFGASLACTPAIYAQSGGLPPVKPLEDIAFVDALRKVSARLRHSPDVHIFTSARLDGRAEVGLSGQLRHWLDESTRNLPHMVESALWLTHRFRTLRALRRLAASPRPNFLSYPEPWRPRLAELHAQRLPTPRFLERLDANRLIEDLFPPHQPRHAEMAQTLAQLQATLQPIESQLLLTAVR